MKKRLLIILGLLPLVNFVFGQEIPVDIVERVNNVDYIFEGEVISSEPYYSNNGQYIHTSNTVNITKRLKGAIECGTIEIITDGGTINSKTLEITHSLTLGIGSKGVFLCKDTDKPSSVIDFYPETNPEILEAPYENQSFIRYWWNGQGVNAADIWNNYDSLALVYNATEAITGLNYIDCQSAMPIINNNDGVITIEEDDFVFPIYPALNIDSINETIHRNYLNSAGDRANDKIFYSLENFIISGTTTKYLEFDVHVKDDYGQGYLDQAMVRFKYNTQVFGPAVVSNTSIAATRGSLISDPSCYSSPTVYEPNNNTVIIKLNALNPSSCRAAVLTTKQHLVHIKMEIVNCSIPSNISLVDTTDFFAPTLVLASSAYAPSPASTVETFYDFVEHNGIKAVPECVTTITDFYPKGIAGGIGDTLNIKGFQFGPTRGSGNVYFKNAEDGGVSEVFLDSIDYAFWSDTLIQIKMPSYDSTIINNIASIGNPAGTGTFRVVSHNGLSDESLQELKVKYSIFNRANKKPSVIAPILQDSNTVIFQCDTAVANYKNGALKAVIDKALRDWTCVTGINWGLGADTAYTNPNLAVDDGLNIIRFDTLSPTTFAATQRWSGNCAGSGLHYETDMVINIEFDWFCDTLGNPLPSNQEAIYSTILHELGHAHGLQHTIESNAVMHFGTLLGVLGNTDVANDYSCVVGGNWMMSYTTNPVNATLCSTVYDNIIKLPNPCSTLAIEKIISSNGEFNIYPNPTSESVSVEFRVDGFKEAKWFITDLNGRLLKSKPVSLIDGSNVIRVDLAELPVGIYVFQISSENSEVGFTSKIVKIN